ncbi:MAG: RlmE family RNA methyltransferase [Deltaproteobacteria bacterium]|nr:RlmE family RNA methyltransferase [Deltaproteobacteria bacterium]
MSPVYKRKDHFYQKAKGEGLASRAVYKLEEMDKRFRLLRLGSRVLELGCAPGGWLQYIVKKIGTTGKAIGVDLLPLKLNFPKHIQLLVGDILDLKIQDQMIRLLGEKADVVLSDLSPNLSGVHFSDHIKSVELCEKALEVAQKTLKPNGALVVKIFPGQDLENFKKKLKGYFGEMKPFIPEATRKSSNELYLVGKFFKQL